MCTPLQVWFCSRPSVHWPRPVCRSITGCGAPSDGCTTPPTLITHKDSVWTSAKHPAVHWKPGDLSFLSRRAPLGNNGQLFQEFVPKSYMTVPGFAIKETKQYGYSISEHLHVLWQTEHLYGFSQFVHEIYRFHQWHGFFPQQYTLTLELLSGWQLHQCGWVLFIKTKKVQGKVHPKTY